MKKACSTSECLGKKRRKIEVEEDYRVCVRRSGQANRKEQRTQVSPYSLNLCALCVFRFNLAPLAVPDRLRPPGAWAEVAGWRSSIKGGPLTLDSAMSLKHLTSRKTDVDGFDNLRFAITKPAPTPVGPFNGRVGMRVQSVETLRFLR